MKIHPQIIVYVVCAICMITTTQSAFASTVSPVQSDAQPFGLEAINPVNLAGSDADSLDFSENALPDLQSTVNDTLQEHQALIDVGAIAVNPNDLFLSEEANLRVYFVGEGAGYRNTFGMYTGDSSDGLSGDAGLIFPNASTSASYYDPTGNTYRSSSAPLAAGDFVDLGTFETNTQLNLFLIANGAGGGTQTYFTDSDLNSDGIEHFIVLATPDSPYLLMGVEDLYGGGDQDYNDIVIAIDIGTTNAAKLIARTVPLPGPVAALIAPLFLMGFRAWNNKNAK